MKPSRLVPTKTDVIIAGLLFLQLKTIPGPEFLQQVIPNMRCDCIS
jgi:hypothetical protein